MRVSKRLIVTFLPHPKPLPASDEGLEDRFSPFPVYGEGAGMG
jgi:hypothetical protein